MNAYERVFGAVAGKKIDCIPAAPYNGNFSIHASGYRLDECYLNGKNLADAQYQAWQKVGQDVLVAQSDQYYLAEALGVKTEYFSDRLPNVLDVPVKAWEDVSALSLIDPRTQGRACVYFEAIERLAEKVKGEAAIRAPGCGAFTLAGHTMGISKFVTEVAAAEAEEDEEAQKRIFELMEITTETLCRYAEECIKAGADIVQDADSLASLDMISPAIYEKYAFPYEQKFFARINALKEKYTFATLLHICGNNTKIAELLGATGCDILEVDYKVDLSVYKSLIGNKVCLLGNMNPAGTILSGNSEEVRKEAEEAVRKGWMGGRFILGSGCEVAVDAPLENVKAMVEFAHSSRPWQE